jgi:predicted metal-binding protein
MNNIIRYKAEMDMESFLRLYVKPEEFISQCQTCPNYGKLWSCPPYDYNVREFWKGFAKIRVTAYKIISGKDGDKIRRDMAEAKELLSEELEAEAQKHPGSTSLAAGCCELCQTCSRLKGKPCLFPEKMRYSIESLGGDAVKILKDLFDIDVQWMTNEHLPDYTVLVGGLLLNQ